MEDKKINSLLRISTVIGAILYAYIIYIFLQLERPFYDFILLCLFALATYCIGVFITVKEVLKKLN